MNKIALSAVCLSCLCGATSIAQVSSLGPFSFTPEAIVTRSINATPPGAGRNLSGSGQGTFNYNTGGYAIAGTLISIGNAKVMSSPQTPNPFLLTKVDLYQGATLVKTVTPSLETSVVNDNGSVKWKASTYSFSFTGTGLTKSTSYTVQVFGTLQNSLGGTQLVATSGFTTPVPEPETYAVAAALGLVGFGIWRRRA
jgi:hypothetical protein